MLEPFLELKLSRFFYLESTIPTFDQYILKKDKLNIPFNSKIDLIIAIDQIYSESRNKKNDFLRKFYQFKYNIYNNFLLILQAKLLNQIKNLIKFCLFFSDEKAYFIDSLKSKFKGKQKIINLLFSTFSFKRILLLIFKQFFK